MRAGLAAAAVLALCAGACSDQGGGGTSGPWRERVLRLEGHERPAELGAGWSALEGPWTWTDGPVAETRFGRPPDPPRPLRLTLVTSSYGEPGESQRVEVQVSGTQVGAFDVASYDVGQYAVEIPPAAYAGADSLTVRLLLPDAREVAPGGRKLGLAVRSIRLSEGSGPPPS